MYEFNVLKSKSAYIPHYFSILNALALSKTSHCDRGQYTCIFSNLINKAAFYLQVFLVFVIESNTLFSKVCI